MSEDGDESVLENIRGARSMKKLKRKQEGGGRWR